MTLQISVKCQKELEEKFLSVKNGPEKVEVIYPDNQISKSPLFSEDYLDCIGVILFSDGFCGLSHYEDYATSPPASQYIPEMIGKIKKLSRRSDSLEYFVFGGDKRHMERVDWLLAQNSVRKIGEFHDGVYRGYHPYKNVAVIPETGEAILKISNYRRKYGDLDFAYISLVGGMEQIYACPNCGYRGAVALDPKEKENKK